MSSKTLVLQISAKRACGVVIESSIGSLHVTQVVDRPSVEEGLGALSAFGPFDRVVASLPAEDAAFRILSLPFSDRRRVAQAVGPSLEEHVPFSLDEAAVAWDYTGAQHTGDVIAAMAPSARIEELRERIEAAVGAPRRLLWGPSAVLAAYRRALGETSSFLALDVGPDGAIIASVENGSVRALRMVAACEPDLMKRNVVWSVRTIAAPGDRIVVGGGWASKLGTALEKELAGLNLEALPAISPVEGFGKRDWRELTGVVGLVLAAAGELTSPVIDFTPAGSGLFGIRSLSELPEEARPLLRWGAAALALLCLSIGLDYFELISQRNVLANRAEEIYVASMPSGSGGTGRKLKMEMRLKELTTRGEGVSGGASGSPLAVMAAVSQAVPKNLDVVLGQLELLPPNVKLAGRADSFEAVTKLQEVLRKAGSFARVDVKDVHAAVAGTGVEFLLDLGIGEPPADEKRSVTEARADSGRDEDDGNDAAASRAERGHDKDGAASDKKAQRHAERDAERAEKKKARAEAKARDKTERGAKGGKGGGKGAGRDKDRAEETRGNKERNESKRGGDGA